jgi:hypothetical protein
VNRDIKPANMRVRLVGDSEEQASLIEARTPEYAAERYLCDFAQMAAFEDPTAVVDAENVIVVDPTGVTTRWRVERNKNGTFVARKQEGGAA